VINRQANTNKAVINAFLTEGESMVGKQLFSHSGEQTEY
jgi:hypothetical protein